MTNREKYITKRNEYDLMMEISKNIEGIGTFCAIKAISDKRIPCVTMMKGNGRMERDCKTCIQSWLNKESE